MTVHHGDAKELARGWHVNHLFSRLQKKKQQQ
jgi:hypothetical protein